MSNPTEKTRITVRNVFQPFPGKKKGKVSTMDGRDFAVWQDKLAQFETGKEYDIEFDAFTTNTGKVIHGITTFAPATGGSHNGNGHASPAASYAGRSPETQARIERQHSQHMALLYCGNGSPDMDWDDFAALVDRFQLDIARTPVALGATTTAAPGPMAAIAAANNDESNLVPF